MFRQLTLPVFIAITLPACGGSESPIPDVAAFRRLNQDVRDVVTEHCTNAATTTDCTAERDRYAAEIGPMLEQMRDMGEDMDACMRDMGHMDSADLQAACTQMSEELEAHLASACSDDGAADRSEAERHCGAMDDLIEHHMDRSDMMQGMMGNMGMMSDGMCHR